MNCQAVVLHIASVERLSLEELSILDNKVNKLGMKHKSSAVKSLAKDLVAKWREVAGTPMSTPKSCASTAKIPFNVMSVGVISKALDYPAATRSSVEHWFWEYT